MIEYLAVKQYQIRLWTYVDVPNQAIISLAKQPIKIITKPMVGFLGNYEPRKSRVMCFI